MAVAEYDDFDRYISKKLVDMNADDEILSTYIRGILDTDESYDEKREALEGILAEITETGISDICSEILTKWTDVLEKKSSETKKESSSVDVDEKLAKLLEESTIHTPAAVSHVTDEQKELKKAILAHYAEVSDGEASCDEDNSKRREQPLLGGRNMNVDAVFKSEKEKREKDKEASQKKKEKDKEDRVKQKAKEDERKEKEKKRTQKGERRR